MPQFHETPGRFIRAVHIAEVISKRSHILCKACFCQEYEIDESSVSTVTATPQDDLLFEKYEALTDGGQCSRCHKEY